MKKVGKMGEGSNYVGMFVLVVHIMEMMKKKIIIMAILNQTMVKATGKLLK